jgi:hypothetical protein
VALAVHAAPAVAANTPFAFLVPAQYIWRVLSVRATLSRAVGGTPTRSLSLTITDGTNTVLASPASDAGTEPGTLVVTWTNAQPAAVSSAGAGVSLGPLPTLTCLAGYVLTGTVVNGASADQWTSAVVWVDERFSG